MSEPYTMVSYVVEGRFMAKDKRPWLTFGTSASEAAGRKSLRGWQEDARHSPASDIEFW